MTKVNVPTDSDLVASAAGGDHQAFAILVRRHQAMVAGLIYSCVGDLHQSEELAQETFVKAWTSLAGLREPPRLAAWLCQIARNCVTDAARRRSTEHAGLRALADMTSKSTPPADAAVLSAEEQELLWRTLSQIPANEREAMVLYYRQGQSTADVSAALQITEGAVRQRLVRGRKLLREQLADLIETGLARSKPTAAFTVAVVSALPAMLPATAKAATVGVTAKGAASGATLAGLAMWIGPAIGVIGGIVGTTASIKSARSPRERQFIIRSGVLIWLLVFIALAASFGLHGLRSSYQWSGRMFALIHAAFWIGYASLLLTMIVLLHRRHQLIRRHERIVESPPVTGANRLSEPHRVWMILGTTVGPMVWLVAMSLQARDTAAAAVLCVLVNVLAALAIFVNRGKTARQTIRYMISHVGVLLGITVVATNLRLHVWMAATGNISLSEAKQRLPFWVLNMLLLVIALAVEGVLMFFARQCTSRADDKAAL